MEWLIVAVALLPLLAVLLVGWLLLRRADRRHLGPKGRDTDTS